LHLPDARQVALPACAKGSDLTHPHRVGSARLLRGLSLLLGSTAALLGRLLSSRRCALRRASGREAAQLLGPEGLQAFLHRAGLWERVEAVALQVWKVGRCGQEVLEHALLLRGAHALSDDLTGRPHEYHSPSGLGLRLVLEALPLQLQLEDLLVEADGDDGGHDFCDMLRADSVSAIIRF
jgi:hypothetical protein